MAISVVGARPVTDADLSRVDEAVRTIEEEASRLPAGVLPWIFGRLEEAKMRLLPELPRRPDQGTAPSEPTPFCRGGRTKTRNVPELPLQARRPVVVHRQRGGPAEVLRSWTRGLHSEEERKVKEAAMRGQGRIFKRTSKNVTRWYIAYYARRRKAGRCR